jgi:hypothetical protein
VVRASAPFALASYSLLLAFALTNAVLYASLLPLWEGFDEPAHYGYVQFLCVARRLPVLKRTYVSEEIRESLRLVPVSWILHNALEGSISFEDWFRLSPEERRLRRAKTAELPVTLGARPSDLLNYEAQQAPLAYLLLAPINAALTPVDLPRRVLWLRVVVAAVSSIGLLAAASLLLDTFGIQGVFRLAALACIFESQMLWASIAHIGNDWLAIPLATLFFALLAKVVRESKANYVFGLAAVLAAGLLTKAYFLAMLPVFLGVLVAQRRSWRTAATAICIVLAAAPWYARNLFLYGSFSGTQESVAGIGIGSAVTAFLQIDWLTSTIDLLRWSLWTGNWSFVSFSHVTLNIELLLLGAGCALFLVRFRQITAAEWWVLAGCAAFFVGLVYQTCVTWAATHGQSQHAEPWYMQCIFPCIGSLAFLGLKRSAALGRALAGWIVLVTAWISAATYVVKLIPLYGGFSGRSTAPALVEWWRHLPAAALSVTILGPLPLVFASLVAFLVLLGAVNIRILAGLRRAQG